MFGHTYYHRTLRKYVTLFGTLFNDIYINRENPETGDTSIIQVPISYGPKQKTMVRVEADAQLNRPYAVLLPRMSFEMTSMSYDSSRKLPTTGKHNIVKLVDSPSKLNYIYNPVPYNIDFELNIMVKNAEDGTKILEQILPYFTPDWTTTVNLIPDAGVKLDIPVVIKSVTSSDDYDGDFTQRRVLTWTLTFTMSGYLFGPVKKSGIIKLANVNFYADTSTTAPIQERVTIQPGLTANGEPTSNIEATVAYSTIEEDDDWTYIVQTTSILNE
jgi:hypothetical protein